MRTVIIVCGYDLDTDLHAYSSAVVEAIGNETFDAIVLSGGRTSPRSTDSEAGVMSLAFAELRPDRVPLLDEKAVNSLENLLHARDLAPADRYLIFCDHAHRMKVSVLAWLVFGRRASVRSVPRPTSWLVYICEPFSLAIESVAAIIPPMRRALHSAAMLMKTLRYGAFFTSVNQ